MKSMCGMDDESTESAFSLRRNVMRGYLRIMKLHRSILESRFKQTKVFRSQHQILMMLSDHNNASQKELAERLYVSTATIAVTVKKLEKGGFITRITDQEDNRINKLCLTEKGKHMVKISREYFSNVEAQMFHDFSKEELIVMEQFLKRIYDNLSQIPMDEHMAEREDL